MFLSTKDMLLKIKFPFLFKSSYHKCYTEFSQGKVRCHDAPSCDSGHFLSLMLSRIGKTLHKKGINTVQNVIILMNTSLKKQKLLQFIRKNLILYIHQEPLYPQTCDLLYKSVDNELYKSEFVQFSLALAHLFSYWGESQLNVCKRKSVFSLKSTVSLGCTNSLLHAH